VRNLKLHNKLAILDTTAGTPIPCMLMILGLGAEDGNSPTVPYWELPAGQSDRIAAGAGRRRNPTGGKRSKLEKFESDAADDQAGDVVVLRGLADEIVEFAQDVFVGGGGALVLHARDQARVSEFFAVFIPRFG